MAHTDAGEAAQAGDVPGAAQDDTDAPRSAEAPVHGDDTPEPKETTLSVFAAAIARKKAAGQERSAHLDGSAKVGGATSNHKSSRMFRRKSG